MTGTDSLLLFFHGGKPFAVESNEVEKISSCIHVHELPGSAPGLLGAFVFGGEFVPAVRADAFLGPGSKKEPGVLIVLSSGTRTAGLAIESAPEPFHRDAGSPERLDIDRLLDAVDALVSQSPAIDSKAPGGRNG